MATHSPVPRQLLSLKIFYMFEIWNLSVISTLKQTPLDLFLNHSSFWNIYTLPMVLKYIYVTKPQMHALILVSIHISWRSL